MVQKKKWYNVAIVIPGRFTKVTSELRHCPADIQQEVHRVQQKTHNMSVYLQNVS